MFHKIKESRIEKWCIEYRSEIIRETIPDIEKRLHNYTSKVPNHVAWDAKLLGNKGPG